MQEPNQLRMKYFPKPCDKVDDCRPFQIWTSLEAGHCVSHIQAPTSSYRLPSWMEDLLGSTPIGSVAP